MSTPTKKASFNSVWKLATATSGTTVTINLDAGAYQTLTLSHNCTIETSNRANSTEAKSVSVLVTASGATRTIALHADINIVGTDITSLDSGSSCWITLVSMGTAETSTHAAFAAVT